MREITSNSDEDNYRYFLYDKKTDKYAEITYVLNDDLMHEMVIHCKQGYADRYLGFIVNYDYITHLRKSEINPMIECYEYDPCEDFEYFPPVYSMKFVKMDNSRIIYEYIPFIRYNSLDIKYDLSLSEVTK